MRILVVEDTDDVADAILAHFSRQGHVCDHAPDLADAQHYAGLDPYDAAQATTWGRLA